MSDSEDDELARMRAQRASRVGLSAADLVQALFIPHACPHPQCSLLTCVVRAEGTGEEGSRP